jgi:hypothetical protein
MPSANIIEIESDPILNPYITRNRGGKRMPDQSIDERERYVAYSTHCLQLVKATADRESRAILREMAQEWLKLVEVTD